MASDGENAIKNLTDKATYDRLEKDLSAVKNEISALADQVSDALSGLTGTARKQARRGYRQAKANVDSVLSDVSERGNAALDAAQSAVTTIEETLEDTIQQRPLATVALAMGLGFLIGVTWRR
ncbi:Protein of unknown function DUF883, ElaB [Nitrobacter winogradskyi Nb-255]|uniref:DUF883 domain-containing protein n=3 Tax=Nitrobacter winogradskyi TaxID=913 RepID=Q3SNX1_NITWN|nr:DUF883 family protein [Nitrobacter winogradskyi]ABA06020.1 Protein of unknown function DUF883, ElaB [Nitrobacter winogradskyi Nb-255]MCP1999517.1 ElaB/YqjD/DUF883 family membrane-anchored ribosome-binding protein [Nitrobacter winogradskyi]GEC16894.1 hypothetical protein NWI01_27860 [Nitrobacter winogradskyi]HRO00435.1 DUF883 family protein [Nitrobacter sp.]